MGQEECQLQAPSGIKEEEEEEEEDENDEEKKEEDTGELDSIKYPGRMLCGNINSRLCRYQ